jgi:hypothetical protein
MRRGMKKMTGREAAHGSGIEPVEIWAYQPKMMSGMGNFQQAVRTGNTVDERLKYLVEPKGAQMIECEFCVDLGSCRRIDPLPSRRWRTSPESRSGHMCLERDGLTGRRSGSDRNGHWAPSELRNSWLV